ncbi:twin-arginine translocation signal domain-containing protein, partial [bacterium]|nr:twin-arginine translocation signal domain-containing protein [bacterium]
MHRHRRSFLALAAALAVALAAAILTEPLQGAELVQG